MRAHGYRGAAKRAPDPKVMELTMTEVERIRALTPQDMLMLGIKDMAYVKDVEVDGETAVALFAANGQQIALMEDRQTAVAAAWQNGLSPMTVH